MPAIETIKLRRGTAAQWTSANPVLAAGEPGYETDTGNCKIGDGTTAWSGLSYRFGSGAYVGVSTPVVWLDKQPGVDPSGVTDSTTAVLAAFAAAKTAGPNGSPAEVRLSAGSTLLLSQPIPLYNGIRLRADLASHLKPTAIIINQTTDVFTFPSGTTGTLSDPRINGVFFQGNPSMQNTSIITPQPVNGSGWVIDDLNMVGCAWYYFQAPIAGSFLRLSLKGFNHNNCSAGMYLAGADSEVGVLRSYVDSVLVGNPARWPAYSGATAYAQNNMVYVQDGSNNKWFYRATSHAGTGNSPATGPQSNLYWTFIGVQFDATFFSSIAAYSSASTYTAGTVVTLGSEQYYALQAVPTNTAPPSGGAAGTQGPGTAGARTSNTYWAWCNNAYGTTSAATPAYHMTFSMVQSVLTNVYPTACPASGILVTGTCAGSTIDGNVVNGYAPGRTDNSGAQLPGIDGEGIMVQNVQSSSTSPSPAGTISVSRNTITNASQDSFSFHGNAVSIINSQRIVCERNQMIWSSWTGGPSVTATQPYRIGQSTQTTSDIRIRDTLLGTSQSVTKIVNYGTGTVTAVSVPDDFVQTLSSGTNTIPIHCPPTIITGGTNSLPAAANVAPSVRAFVANGTASPVTLGSAGGNINGAASLSIPANSAVIAVSDGTNWWAT